MQEYPKKNLAQLVIKQCIANEIENVVISPGSRNAPLTIGFVNHPKINAMSIVDERSAAFFALGIVQQTRKPVVILCSSGSALLNYYPAIAEAFYSNLPLIVISSDRPKHLIDIGDGQTIRQENVFENHILFSANLIEEEESSTYNKLSTDKLSKSHADNYRKADILEHNNLLLREALFIAQDQKGPVHINVPFDEPLYEVVKDLYIFDFKIENKVNKSHQEDFLDEIPLDVEDLQKFADIWNSLDKKMVLVGANYPDKLLQTQLSHIIKDPSVLVLTETTSNFYHENFVNSIDKLIIPLDKYDLNKLQPKILLTLGGMIVSKRIKQFLREYQPKHHWHIDKKNAPDTFHCLDHHFNISPQLFFSQFFFLTKEIKSDFQNYWLNIKNNRQVDHNKFLNKVNFSDLKVFDIILKSLPHNIQLQLSNSSVIRYSQLFNLRNTLKVFCNRGTSGIDGSTSTAIGAAYAQTDQTVFITGDISFLYDSNALWNKYIKKDFRIILINNSGGGIFRFIPGPKSTNALDFFETSHNKNALYLSRMFNFKYFSATNSNELRSELKSFYRISDKPKLLEIFTPREINDKVLKDYFSRL